MVPELRGRTDLRKRLEASELQPAGVLAVHLLGQPCGCDRPKGQLGGGFCVVSMSRVLFCPRWELGDQIGRKRGTRRPTSGYERGGGLRSQEGAGCACPEGAGACGPLWAGGCQAGFPSQACGSVGDHGNSYRCRRGLILMAHAGVTGTVPCPNDSWGNSVGHGARGWSLMSLPWLLSTPTHVTLAVNSPLVPEVSRHCPKALISKLSPSLLHSERSVLAHSFCFSSIRGWG